MRYRVRYVDDAVMPTGHDWVICEQPGETTLCLRKSMADLPLSERERILEEAWVGWAHRMSLPRHRVSA